MPSNPNPNLSQAELMTLAKLLRRYEHYIRGEQPLGAEVIGSVARWVTDDIEDENVDTKIRQYLSKMNIRRVLIRE